MQFPAASKQNDFVVKLKVSNSGNKVKYRPTPRPKKEIKPATTHEAIGRPPSTRTQLNDKRQQFEELCRIHCTQEEIESVLGVSNDGLMSFVKATYACDFTTAYGRFSNDGKKAMRRKLYEMAMNDLSKSQLGALVWWTKNNMQFSDKTEVRSINDPKMNEDIGLLAGALVDLLGGTKNVIAAGAKPIENTVEESPAPSLAEGPTDNAIK